nr:ABC transporter substrate-binding protein [uncultured Schaedlerella sp.]
MKKRTAKLCMAAVCVSLLAGCGNSGNSNDSGNGKSSNESGSEEERTITVLHNLNEDSAIQWLDAVTADFEEQNPGIKVDMEVLASDDYNSMLRNKIASDDVPDLFFLNDINKMGEFIEAGLCQDLSGESWLEENVQESAIEACRSEDGTVNVVPLFIGGMYVTYNKDVFQAAGIEEVPETWSGFIQACKKIQESGVAAIACGYQDAWTIYSAEQCDSIVTTLKNDPENRIDLEAGTTTFTEDKGKFSEVLSRMKESYQYTNSDPFGTDWNTAVSMLATGEAGMIINGSWTASAVVNVNPDVNIGIFPLPLTENEEDALLPLHTNSGGFAVYSESERKDDALAFAECLSTPESGALMQELKGDISASKNVEVPEDSLLYEVTRYIEEDRVFDWSGYTEQFVSDELQQITTDVEVELLTSDMTVEEALKKLDEKFAAALSAQK